MLVPKYVQVPGEHDYSEISSRKFKYSNRGRRLMAAFRFDQLSKRTFYTQYSTNNARIVKCVWSIKKEVYRGCTGRYHLVTVNEDVGISKL
jgi:hypothetical protein